MSKADKKIKKNQEKVNLASLDEKLILLQMSAHEEENGEVTIKATTPVSFVEMTCPNEEVALQIFSQLGKRLLTTIESELEELQGDMED